GSAPVQTRELYWRYKANEQEAMRDGSWKYLKIKDNCFLFDLSQDSMERANRKDRYPEVMQSMRERWTNWSETMLPLTSDVGSYGQTPATSADRYAPDSHNLIIR